ncbi:RND family efflux transporter MFP subunit [Paraburkholderia sp. GV068]|jgi:RND family efflux transporter MFP subunit|uniref:efflux RND transporter periplasmic adaptor subunit n=1 Tax=Paraburkholderia TaxID=1822464 RepID=UPI000D306C3E|nr:MULTISPECIES: efflux RND transporter periplasmic adaptor subunit [Paraburkholderia]MDR6476956.1 RND family efflux transporter MFP subunit [Paraburkholderia graminis]PTQ94299.1 RND family efflux transporter MFP subunit [Paraburkholderia sp. GV072]PUB01160.1 RND family efflux transporter MFP subunit [Paraburkholderia sp. GV068]
MTTSDLPPTPDAATRTNALPVSRAAANNEAVKRRRLILPVALAAVAAALLALGIVPRLHASTALTEQVYAQREVPVETVAPTRAPASQELLLPGSVTPYADASIYARTSGYVQHWYADIGTKVKAGQTLADIQTPELDAQLKQARADEATAKANYAFANSTAQRWQTMLKTQSVSQQDTDAKTSDSEAKLAALQSAQANVARLTELVSYEKVTAPFDGVVTVRNVDVGALVTSGGSPGLAGMPGELFHIEQTDRLRIFVNVPQDDASSISTGTLLYLTTQQYPGRRFAATVARSANAIDPVSRTLRVEVDVDNHDGALLPGAYAQVHLALQTAHPALELPVSALLFRPDGVTVAVIGKSNTVQLKTVTIGRDFGTYVEIATGVEATDRVINNPGDAISNGEAVRVVASAALHG